MTNKESKSNSQNQKQKVKVIVKSLANGICKPCEEVKKEAEALAENNPDIDIELVEVIIDPKVESFENKGVSKYFGDKDNLVFPVTIVETECKSKKIVGYNPGDLEKAIKEVQCDIIADDRNSSE